MTKRKLNIKYTGGKLYTAEELIEAGINNKAYHGKLNDSGGWPPRKEILVRWAQNAFRHTLTNYDDELEKHADGCATCRDDMIETFAVEQYCDERDVDAESLSAESIEEIVQDWYDSHRCERETAADDIHDSAIEAVEQLMDSQGLDETELEFAAMEYVDACRDADMAQT